jgi:hypothetical protein
MQQKEKVLFEETQHFRQWWVWLALLLTLALLSWGVVEQLFFHKAWGTNPAPDWALILIILVIVALVAFFYFLGLETKINQSGIYWRWHPFQRKYRSAKWQELEKVSVVKYSPLWEYGGWGIRIGFHGGLAYTIAGRKGIQLYFKNGKKLLLGTQKAEEAQAALSTRSKI